MKYKKKQLNTYTAATSYMYNAQVLSKHAHLMLNEQLLLSVVCACTLLRALTEQARENTAQ
jgi:hypothetical protein